MATAISIIIPVFNEELHIEELLQTLVQQKFGHIIVVDGESTDATLRIVKKYPSVRLLSSAKRGRAHQMNYGAQFATTKYLLFLHADVLLPTAFHETLTRELQHKEIQIGNFRLNFTSSNRFLRLNAKFSHFKSNAFQFGDQGLVIQKVFFDKLSGFDTTLLFMEGNDIIKRGKEKKEFHKLPITIRVSARKYEQFGIYRLQFIYISCYLLVAMGVKQERIVQLFSSIFKK